MYLVIWIPIFELVLWAHNKITALKCHQEFAQDAAYSFDGGGGGPAVHFRLARPRLPPLPAELADCAREGALWAEPWDTVCLIPVLPLDGEEAEPWDTFWSVPLIAPEGGAEDKP